MRRTAREANMNRREALGALVSAGFAMQQAVGQSAEMIYRPLGKTRFELFL